MYDHFSKVLLYSRNVANLQAHHGAIFSSVFLMCMYGNIVANKRDKFSIRILTDIPFILAILMIFT